MGKRNVTNETQLHFNARMIYKISKSFLSKREVIFILTMTYAFEMMISQSLCQSATSDSDEENSIGIKRLFCHSKDNNITI